jgi:hypothetical protein
VDGYPLVPHGPVKRHPGRIIGRALGSFSFSSRLVRHCGHSRTSGHPTGHAGPLLWVG